MSKILLYQNLTDPQISQLNKEQAILILPLSLMEAHGPHLPLGTDFIIAGQFAQLLAQKIVSRFKQQTPVLLPAVPLGVGGIERPGTLNHDASLIRNTIIQFGQRLGDHGFEKGIVVSGHAGQRHLKAMSSAARKLKGQFDFLPLTSYLFLDTGLKKIAAMIRQTGNDLPPYDGHAGLWETSVMMYLQPEQINGEHRHLPVSNDAEANGYRGNPAGANQAIGEKLVNFLLEVALMIIEKHFKIEG